MESDTERESSDGEENSELSDSWQSGITPDLELDLGRDDDEETQVCGGFDAGGLLAPLTLVQQCCRVLANSWAFEEVVQSFSAPIPDDIQQSIAFWAFPRDERKIKMYATLGSPSPDFSEAEQLLRKGRLKKMYQIGFQLCARFSSGHKIQDISGQSHGSDLQSSIHFNQGCITSCSCTCKSNTPWCSHVVAACLAQVRYPNRTELRPLLSASLMQLDQVQLQKFSQYLIARAPSDVLFIAQELLDEFRSPTSDINIHPGAPDITSGDQSSEEAEWLLDTASMELILKEQAAVLLSSASIFLETPSLPDPVPDTVETFQRLLTAVSYRLSSAFRVNYLSMIASLLKERNSNAFTLLRSATLTLVDRIPTNSPLPLALETTACAMIADLAPLWMQAALALPKLGMQIVSSGMKFKTRLSRKWCFSANARNLFDKPLAFVAHCAGGGSLRFGSVCLPQPESTPSCATLEDESSRVVVTAEGVKTSSCSSEPTSLAAIIQKKLHPDFTLTTPALSPVNQVLCDNSQLGQMGPHALLAILTYLDHCCQEYGKACAEAIATWVFHQQRPELVANRGDSSIPPICLLNPHLIVSTNDHMAFLRLARMVLQLLQRNVLSLTFAVRVLLLPFSSQQAPLEMLVFSHEQTVLDEIEAYLSTCGSVETLLTAFAAEAARTLLSCSVAAVEQGRRTPPYSATLAIFGILTCGKKEDSQLFKLASTMVLHTLRLNPMTSSVISMSAESDKQRRDISQFCVWKRFAALLLKVLLTCDACFGKEVTTLLEATFPLPTDFETSAKGERADMTSPPERDNAFANNLPLQSLLNATEVWEGREEVSQEIEKPLPASATVPCPEEYQSVAATCTGSPVIAIPASLNLSVVYLLQELANKLLRMKESTGLAGMEKLATLELYLLCLRTRNCSDLHWGRLEHYSSEEISSDLSKLIAHVGEPALLVLHRKWSLCLTPSCVVQGVSKACFLPDSRRLLKGFSAHAVCQIMKSALQRVKYMDCSSIQVALEICCKSRMKHAAEVMDILMSMPKHSISSRVFFSLASNMLEVHQYSLARLEEIEDGSFLEQQPIIGEDWNEDHDETSFPGLCSSILGTPASKSLLAPTQQPSGLSHALSTNLPNRQCSQRAHEITHMAPQCSYESTHTAVCIRKRRAQMHEFLHRAFRAGMRGMETLASERDEESLKYDHLKAPSYASDVRMLLDIACSMGNLYIRTFLQALPPAVGSPHVLYEASLTIAHHLSQNHPHQLAIHLRNKPLLGIVQDAMLKFAKFIEKQALVTKNTSCRREVVEMIREMEEMSKCYQTGDKELGNFLTSLVDGLGNNKKMRQLIMKEFQGYVHVRHFGDTSALKSKFGHQTCTDIDVNRPSPFPIACEMWDD